MLYEISFDLEYNPMSIIAFERDQMSSNFPELNLQIHANVTSFSGLDEETARRLFGYSNVEFQANDQGSISRVKRNSTEYLREPDSDVTTIPTCRLQEVEQVLHRAGFSTRQENGIPDFGHPDLSWTAEQPAWVQEFARLLSANPVGRITVRCDRDRKDTVTLVCDLFKATNVVIVTPNLREVQKFIEHIDEIQPERATKSFGDLNGSTQRVLICCEPTFIKSDPGYFNVLLFTDLLKSLGKKILQDTISLDQHRIYAIEDLQATLDRGQKWKAEYLAGRTLFSFVSLQNRCSVFFHVINIPSVGGPGVGKGMEAKKRSIWENQRRNQIIAEVAESFTSRQPRDDIPLPDELKSRQLRVTILVESLTHARILKSIFPDWETLSRLDTPSTFAAPHRTIITRLWANSQKTS